MKLDNRDDSFDYVVYKGKDRERRFKIPRDEFDTLRHDEDNVSFGNDIASERGGTTINNNVFCALCNHYRYNVLSNLTSEIRVINHFPDCNLYVEGCNYRNNNPKHTSSFRNNRSGHEFTAWANPCVVSVSRIEYLIKSGQLNEFEFQGEVPDFPNINHLFAEFARRDKSIPANRRKRSLLSKGYVLLRSKIRGQI